MLTVLQRVTHAFVEVAQEKISEISEGLLILCGFERTDNELTLEQMLHKCINYRLFSNEHDKMTHSLKDIQGSLLLVPQFTLVAETTKGLRPSFSKGASAEQGSELFARLVTKAQALYPWVYSGQFGATMKVHLCNNGPVTFILHFN